MNTNLTLLEVETIPELKLELNLKYGDSTNDFTISVEKGYMYDITYLDAAKLCKVVGRVVGVSMINSLEEKSYPLSQVEYLIKLDASANCVSDVRKFKTSQVRDIKRFIKYADEDTTINNSIHRTGIAVGGMSNVIIANATIDTNNNITKGTIIGSTDVNLAIKGGTLVGGTTTGGIATGRNVNGNTIVTIDGTTVNGIVTTGTVVSGIIPALTEYEISGGTTVDGITTGALIEAAAINSIIVLNATVEGGKTSGGIVIDPTLENSIVTGATVTGVDMETIGAIVTGDVATGGTTTGGTGTGGTATGNINGKTYTIIDGTTKGGTVTGGLVIGGTVTGGYQIGNSIVGAIITGGTVVGGTIVGGVTQYGVITALNSSTITYTDVVSEEATQPDPTDTTYTASGFIITNDSVNGVGSNIDSVNL